MTGCETNPDSISERSPKVRLLVETAAQAQTWKLCFFFFRNLNVSFFLCLQHNVPGRTCYPCGRVLHI